MIPPQTSRLGRFIFRKLEQGLPLVLGRDRGVATLESVCSFSPALCRAYCASREPLTRIEYDYLLRANRGSFEGYRKVVMVGGGSVPATAIYWANRFDKPIVVLDKSRLSTRLGSRLLRKLGFGHVEFLRLEGEAYDGYSDSIVLLSLHLTNKQAVADRAVTCGGRMAICVRVARNEKFDTNAARWDAVKKYADFDVFAALTGDRQLWGLSE